MKKRVLVMAVAGVALVAMFQNCSNKGLQIEDQALKASEAEVDLNGTPEDVSQPNASVPVSTTPSPSPSASPSTPPPTTVTELINNCEDAKARGKIESVTSQIVFEDNVGQCAWGTADNLPKLDAFAQARIEQVRKVNVPAGAIVCQVQLEDVDQQNFRYDDNLLLTLNNYLLAATSDFQSNFQNKNGYYLYDWSRLKGKDGKVKDSDTVPAKQYCAGKDQGLSACSFPLTDTKGSVQLQFSERVIQNILGMTSASDINLTMITTGDNDASTDCRHNPIRFNVKVHYYF